MALWTHYAACIECIDTRLHNIVPLERGKIDKKNRNATDYLCKNQYFLKFYIYENIDFKYLTLRFLTLTFSISLLKNIIKGIKYNQ